MANATQVVEVNCETGEVTKRPFTSEEIAQHEIEKADYEARKAQAEAEAQVRAELKASALAKLATLGLTEDEAKAIAG